MWKKKEVLTFVADITPLLKREYYDKIYEEVPDFRKEKADRMKRCEDRAQSIGAWGLWMEVQKILDLDETVPFNLSHSGNYALCSVAPVGEKIGCDIEMIGRFREKVAKRFFCETEYRLIMSKQENERCEWFYRFWVLKESFIKATRKGMALPLNTFEIGFAGHRPELVRKPEEFPESYYYREYQIGGARIACCSTCSDFAENYQKILL